MKHTLIAILMCAVSFTANAQGLSPEKRCTIDSLRTALQTMPMNIDRLETELTITDLYAESLLDEDLDSAMHYANMLMDHAHLLDEPHYEFVTNFSIAEVYSQKKDLEGALKYYYRNLAICDSTDDISAKSYTCFYLARTYSQLNNVDMTIKFYKEAIKLARDEQNTEYDLLPTCYMGMSLEYVEHSMFDDVIEQCDMVIELTEWLLKEGNLDSARYATNEVILQGSELMKTYAKAQKSVISKDYPSFLKDKAEMFEKTEQFGMIEPNILPYLLIQEIESFGITGRKRSELLDSCRYYLDIAYRNNETNDAAIQHSILLANYHTLTGNYRKAQHVLDSLNTIIDCNDFNNTNTEELIEQYIKLYKASGNLAELTSFMQKMIDFHDYRDQNFQSKSVKAIAEIEYEEAMERHEKESARREGELQAEAKWRTWIIVLLIAVVALIVRSYVNGRKTNRRLNEQNTLLQDQKEEIITQNESLEQQKNIISRKNQEITDSINYASLIQRAALPSDAQMKNLFPKSFVIYQPLNIVSGDFYWATQAGNLKLLAVADCTGHGVPGAFVSMLGISILNDIAKDADPLSITASGILNQMRSTFKQDLRQHGGENDNRDGMDMGVLILNPSDLTLQYAGAFRPLLICRQGEIIKVNADRMPIGSHHKEEPFSNNTVQLCTADRLFLFSDGLTDQFGYDEKGEVHKFSSKRLLSLIAGTSAQPLAEQQKSIEDSRLAWRTGPDGTLYEQTDDAIMVCIEV